MTLYDAKYLHMEPKRKKKPQRKFQLNNSMTKSKPRNAQHVHDDRQLMRKIEEANVSDGCRLAAEQPVYCHFRANKSTV